MNRLGLSVALVSSLVAGCVGNDQTDSPETSASAQAATVAGCVPSPGGLCPIAWNSDITAPGAYWAGHGTTNPAKVMAIFYFPTKADPTTGLATAYYAWMMAGYDPTCVGTIDGGFKCTPNNNAWRIYEVAASQISTFQAIARYDFNLHENQNPTNGVWDGGAGGGLSGSPGHPIGPGGVDPLTIQQIEANFGSFRGLYVNSYNAFNRSTATGIAAQ